MRSSKESCTGCKGARRVAGVVCEKCGGAGYTIVFHGGDGTRFPPKGEKNGEAK